MSTHPIEGLSGVVVEWEERVIDGKIDPLTRRDTRKIEYRFRALREKTGAILYDTNKFVTANRARELLDSFTKAQKVVDDAMVAIRMIL